METGFEEERGTPNHLGVILGHRWEEKGEEKS
jgi:hypothetical protein